MPRLNAANSITEENLTMTQAFRRFMLQVDDNLPIIGTGSPEGIVEAPQFSLFVNADGVASTIEYRKMETDIGGDRSKGWELTAGGGGGGSTTWGLIIGTLSDQTDLQNALNALEPLDQERMVFVSKAGNDSDAGLNTDTPKLTISAAITAASAFTPTTTSHVSIVIIDSGNYSESFSVPSFVNIIGLSAAVDGSITMEDSSSIRLRKCIKSSVGGSVVKKDAGTGLAIFEVDVLLVSDSTQNGARVNMGEMQVKIGALVVDGGIGIKAKNGSHVTFDIGEVSLLNGGIGIGTQVAGGSPNTFIGNVLHATDDGTGVLLRTKVDGDDINIYGGVLEVDTLYDLGVNTVLNAFTNIAIGTRTEDPTATANVVTLSGDSSLGGSLNVEGSLTLSGTVDGRDIDADGTKLDGIATGAQVNTIDSGDNVSELVNDAGYTTNTGTVTSVGSGTGLTGGPITGSGTIDLANTAVTPASYTSADITVDAQGRITAASNGSGGGSVYSFNRVIGATTQSVTSTLTAITWSSSNDSSGSDVTFSGGNPTRLTAVSTGTYKVGGYVTINSAAQRAQTAIEIMINGVATGFQRSGTYLRNSGTAYDFWTMELSSTPFTLTASDFVELAVGQVTGATYGYSGSLTINCDRSVSEFWLERVA